MPSIGLVVEGVYDEAVISALVRRCRPGVSVIPRKCRGTVTGKLRGILADFRRSYRIEKVLILSDADGQDPQTLITTMRSQIAENFPFTIHPLVAVQNLEAWLIADPAALESVLGVTKSFRSPEKIPHPKAELLRLFPRSKNYTPVTAQEIAETLDLNVLKKRCPSFAAFHETVLDP